MLDARNYDNFSTNGEKDSDILLIRSIVIFEFTYFSSIGSFLVTHKKYDVKNQISCFVY